MANKQDILTAIKNLDLFLKVTALKGAKARFNKNGNPFVFVGGFNMVFQLTHNFKKWAFRVWHVPMGENEERYLKISAYLSSKRLPYFAEFIYDQNGILVNGELIDTIRMEWLEGILLKEFLEKNLTNPIALNKLADEFLVMCKTLRENKISHGDLQEGNILINEKDELKLVDYDSICIPEIEGSAQLVTGLKGYQHPSRFKGGAASLKADYFSELIIYISIVALSKKPELWSKYQIKDTQYLLFSETDFDDFEHSNIYHDLHGISNKLDRLLTVLIDYINTNNYTDLKPFQNYLEPPIIQKFSSDKEVLIQGAELELSWKVENALKVSISNVGEVKPIDSIKLKPQGYFEYELTAIGFRETIIEKLEIKVFPTPIIESIQVPIPIFHKTTNLAISVPQFPNVALNIENITSSLNVNIDDSIQIRAKEIRFNELDKNFKRGKKKGIYNKLYGAFNFSKILNKIPKNKSNSND